eukprot:1149589-Pelagomonas_calceolata.AAC.5
MPPSSAAPAAALAGCLRLGHLLLQALDHGGAKHTPLLPHPYHPAHRAACLGISRAQHLPDRLADDFAELLAKQPAFALALLQDVVAKVQQRQLLFVGRPANLLPPCAHNRGNVVLVRGKEKGPVRCSFYALLRGD